MAVAMVVVTAMAMATATVTATAALRRCSISSLAVRWHSWFRCLVPFGVFI
jgi:hypothetical protein